MDRQTLAASKAWPVTEALELEKRLGGKCPEKGYALFQTGYGPSGLPHIGTFAEVFRTTLIRHAFEQLTGMPTELFAFSDDMDGLRKIPDNVPGPERLQEFLHRPLTAVPDPYGTHESYGANMNARLQAFLDHFGFAYEFRSATEQYKSGIFDETLRKVLEHHEAICNIVRPHLGAERRATYSPILPISPKTGRVLQVALEGAHPEDGTISFRDEDGALERIPVTGGHCKLQWRADWAMRWTALEVDYEMSGKDLIDSVKLGGRICRQIGGTPPAGFSYELFLDENAQKISKSRGNGLTIDEWLRYGTPESLKLFLFQSPRKAKRLYFDVIPKHVDEYQTFMEAYPNQETAKRLGNPLFYLHDGEPPYEPLPITFIMLLNLASVVNAETPDVLWGFIQHYAPETTPENTPKLATLVEHALAYYQDFIKPSKKFAQANAQQRAALIELKDWLDQAGEDCSAADLQNEVYEVGKRHGFDNLRDWFKTLYQVLLGQEEGPRFGSFIGFYGVGNTARLIEERLQSGDHAA